MKRTIATSILAALLAGGSPRIEAQSSSNPTLANVVGVYVFPTKGQNASQQSQDEAACYQWAVKQTGSDPFQLQKQAQALQQQQAAASQAASTPTGSGARGAAGGAAAGALFGAIGGNAGTGAAVGAATGFVAGRIRGRHQQAQAADAAEKTASAQQATQQQIDNFKKAFSACLEGKNYIAK